MSWYVDAARRLGHHRATSWIGRWLAPRVDRLVHRLTGGRILLSRSLMPTLLLTTTGRRSGQPRVQPLSYVERDGVVYVVASNWGGTEHPAWSWNLLDDPDATIEIDGRTLPVRARLVDPDERAATWPTFTAMWPAYDTYLERTDRDIRMFALEPRRD